jgi:hypothetical protein
MAGNATLTTNSTSGSITTEIWLQSINTQTDTQFDDNQIKRGMSHRPIRRLENFLSFTAIWSLQHWDAMDQLQENIRKHYLMLASGDETPMTLIYPADNLTFQGWIENVEKQFIRFQDIFVRTYRMNILLPDYLSESFAIASNDSLVNPNSLQYYGEQWYATQSTNVASVLSSPNKLIAVHATYSTGGVRG